MAAADMVPELLRSGTSLGWAPSGTEQG